MTMLKPFNNYIKSFIGIGAHSLQHWLHSLQQLSHSLQHWSHSSQQLSHSLQHWLHSSQQLLHSSQINNRFCF